MILPPSNSVLTSLPLANFYFSNLLMDAISMYATYNQALPSKPGLYTSRDTTYQCLGAGSVSFLSYSIGRLLVFFSSSCKSYAGL